MTRVSFKVLGVAEPKGSTRAFMRPGMKFPIVTSTNRSVKGWEDAVRAAAQQQCGGVFFDGPIRLAAVFFLPRPQSLPKRVLHHTKKPDLDKLLRSIGDALTGVLYADDNLIVEFVARKGYAATQPHVIVVVEDAAPVDEVAIDQNLFTALDELRA